MTLPSRQNFFSSILPMGQRDTYQSINLLSLQPETLFSLLVLEVYKISCQSEYFCSEKYLWLHSILCNHVKCICARKPRKKRKKKAKNRELQQTLPWYCPRRKENLSFIRCLTIT